jgi:hypothetical protein
MKKKWARWVEDMPLLHVENGAYFAVGGGGVMTVSAPVHEARADPRPVGAGTATLVRPRR